jgi:hypothetical protein
VGDGKLLKKIASGLIAVLLIMSFSITEFNARPAVVGDTYEQTVF